VGKHRFERVSGDISCGLLGRAGPGGQIVPVDLTSREDGGQTAGRKSPAAATLILGDLCMRDHLIELIEIGC